MIPKILYFAWFGERKPVTLNYVMQMYKKVNRDFDIRFVFEKDPANPENADAAKCLSLVREKGSKYNNIFRRYEKRGFGYAFAKAFACYMIDSYGGIYADCDTFPVKRFDDALLSKKYFQCRTTAYQRQYEVGSYLIGAEAGSDVYPYAKNDCEYSVLPFFLHADDLNANPKTRRYLQKKFEQCQLALGQTYEQFPTQYVNHYNVKDALDDPRCIVATRMIRENTCRSNPSAKNVENDGVTSANYISDEISEYKSAHTVNRISVVLITHNRTNVAKYTLGNLIRYIRFDGDIRWIIADDMSDDGHVQELVQVLDDNNVTNYTVTKTSSYNHGLGSSMNNGLREAFAYSPVALTAEDDFAIEKNLDITDWVNYLDQSGHAIIRLAYREKKLRKERATRDLEFISGDAGNPWLFNNQVAIRHQRIYDALGFYPENASPDTTEVSLRNAYNSLTNYGSKPGLRILVPARIKESTFDHDSLIFTHIGKSTCKHDNYSVPERYRFVYEEPESVFYNITCDDLLRNSFVISISDERISRFNTIFEKSGLMPLPKPFEGFSNPDIKSGPYKCELSHAAIVKAAKALGLPFVCIFEDDAYPAENVRPILEEQLKSVPQYAKIILIGWLDSFSETTRDAGFRGVGYAYGSHAYIVTKAGYDEYLASYRKKPDIVADQFEHFVDKSSIIRISRNAFIQYSEGSMHGFSGYAIGKNINKNCLKRPPAGFPDISNFNCDNEKEDQ